MYHQHEIRQIEIMPGKFTTQQSLLPSVLKRRGNVVNVVTLQKLEVRDTIQDYPFSKRLEVLEILEQRKAIGNWGNTSYKVAPYWQKIKIA